jgi:hypothetical protein
MSHLAGAEIFLKKTSYIMCIIKKNWLRLHWYCRILAVPEVAEPAGKPRRQSFAGATPAGGRGRPAGSGRAVADKGRATPRTQQPVKWRGPLPTHRSPCRRCGCARTAPLCCACDPLTPAQRLSSALTGGQQPSSQCLTYVLYVQRGGPACIDRLAAGQSYKTAALAAQISAAACWCWPSVFTEKTK